VHRFKGVGKKGAAKGMGSPKELEIQKVLSRGGEIKSDHVNLHHKETKAEVLLHRGEACYQLRRGRALED